MDDVVRMVDVPGRARPVADEAGHQTGNQGVVAHPADHEQDFQSENRTGQRRPEHGAEAAADAGHEQDAVCSLSRPSLRATQLARLPPICTAVPSRPAEPPNRCVTTVDSRMTGRHSWPARRSTACGSLRG